MITLFHVSDVHFGREDKAALAWFADAVEQGKPDAVICTGDLTWRGTAREFDAAAKWLASLAAPVTVEPGNHDIPYYWDMGRRLMRPFDRYQALEVMVEKKWALQDIAVVPLCTVARAQWRINQSKGRVSRRELSDTLEGIAATKNTPLRLVTCHHPLVDADTHSSGSTRGGKAALATLAKAGVTAVLSGHVHDPFDLTVQTAGGEIRMIGAGTLSERLRATRPSYNRLEWSVATGLSVKVQTF